MVRALTVVAAFSVGLAGAPPLAPAPAAPASSPPVKAACGSSETPLYRCPLKTGAVAVCATPQNVVYRFQGGRSGLEISSNGTDGRSHRSGLRGPDAASRQASLRFSTGGFEYIVHATVDALDGGAERRTSGVTVLKDGKLLSNLPCPLTGPAQTFRAEDLPAFVPRDTDSRYVGWY